MTHTIQRALCLMLLVSGLCALFPTQSFGDTLAASPATGEGQTPPDPVVLRADETGIVLEWRAPDFSSQRVSGDDGRSYSTLDAPGWIDSAIPGQPQLPLASVLAVVPPGGEITLRVQVLEQDHHPLSHPVLPALDPVVVGTAPDATIEWTWARNEQTYAQTYATGRSRFGHASKLYPAEIVTLEEVGWQRGRRLVRLTFSPLRFDPSGPALDVVRHARVELGFSDEGINTAGGWSGDDPFIPLLQRAVINPDQVIRFGRPARSAVKETRAAGALESPGSRYKLLVSQEGVYELTWDALIAAGVPVTTTAYRLEHAGEDVAYQWESDGDALFEAGERLLFYARPTPTRFADHDVYWLTVGASGTQMAARTGDPSGLSEGVAWATTVAEQDGSDQQYLGRYLSEWDADHWYWDRLYWDYKTGTGAQNKDFEVTLPALDGEASATTLRIYLQGSTRNNSLNPDHRIQVRLNDGAPHTAEWDGDVYHTATFSPPASLLHAGANTVNLQLPGTGASSGVEEAWLDAIELRYGLGTVTGDSVRVEGESGRKQYTIAGFGSDDVRIYDVSDPAAPQVVIPFNVNGGSVNFGDAGAGTATYYLLVEDQIAAPDEIVPALTLADPPADTDYLIITHSDFVTAVAPLAAHRAISLTVFTATAQEIYDSYSSGVTDPLAIREYISHTYWSTSPHELDYVLLVGDGVNAGAANQYIPPYLITDPRGTGTEQIPSDNRFVTLEGDDELAEVLIGRLPVNTEAEAEIVVTKIISYELNTPQWPWNERTLFFAGEERTSYGKYHGDSDSAYEYVPDGLRGERAYFCLSNCGESYKYGDTVIHDEVMNRLGSGALLASYVGHSSIHEWDQDGIIFHLNNIASLNNGLALPVFLEMTCYTSDFSYPGLDTLDETLVRHAGGGAIATWGPTTVGLSNGHKMLHRTFLQVVGTGITGLGEIIQETKTQALPGLEVTDSLDLLDTFVLLGDPAMKLNRSDVPWPQQMFLPAVMRGG